MSEKLFGMAVEWTRLQYAVRKQGGESTAMQLQRHRYLASAMSLWEWWEVAAAKEAAPPPGRGGSEDDVPF